MEITVTSAREGPPRPRGGVSVRSQAALQGTGSQRAYGIEQQCNSS